MVWQWTSHNAVDSLQYFAILTVSKQYLHGRKHCKLVLRRIYWVNLYSEWKKCSIWKYHYTFRVKLNAIHICFRFFCVFFFLNFDVKLDLKFLLFLVLFQYFNSVKIIYCEYHLNRMTFFINTILHLFQSYFFMKTKYSKLVIWRYISVPIHLKVSNRLSTKKKSNRNYIYYYTIKSRNDMLYKVIAGLVFVFFSGLTRHWNSITYLSCL